MLWPHAVFPGNHRPGYRDIRVRRLASGTLIQTDRFGNLLGPILAARVWIAFFGADFVAAGLSLTFNFLPDWGAASIGLTYAIWVVTSEQLLGPTSGGSGPRAPDEWSRLFIAIALWVGSWALASNGQVRG